MVQSWFLGHNVSESWILDVRPGDVVMVDGKQWHAVETWDVSMGAQVDGTEAWFGYPAILQTCLFDGAHMRLVGLSPVA